MIGLQKTYQPNWTLDDVRSFIEGYDLRPNRLAAEQLESWWVNLVLRVDADDQRFILRRYGATPVEGIRWELAVLEHLRANDFPTIAPLPLASDPDERLGAFLGGPAVLYPYIEGERAQGQGRDSELAQTAAAVARLHELTSELSIPYSRGAAGTESRGMLWSFLDFVARRGIGPDETALAQLVAVAKDALEQFEARLAPLAGELPQAVVHHDAHQHNVLFHEGKLVALLDFDDAYDGYMVADPARMVSPWAHTPMVAPIEADRAATVVREYERHRRLTPGERELFPDFTMLYMLADDCSELMDRLGEGRPSADAVDDCIQYKRYLHLVDNGAWWAEFRAQLGWC